VARVGVYYVKSSDIAFTAELRGYGLPVEAAMLIGLVIKPPN
jgi:hypothetical protein